MHVIIGEDVAAEGVHIDHRGAPFSQQGGHCGLAGADASTEANDPNPVGHQRDRKRRMGLIRRRG
jgi:hypothetical protein